MSQGPEEMRFLGIERDSISGRIAKALHPDQDIRVGLPREGTLDPFSPACFGESDRRAQEGWHEALFLAGDAGGRGTQSYRLQAGCESRSRRGRNFVA